MGSCFPSLTQYGYVQVSGIITSSVNFLPYTMDSENWGCTLRQSTCQPAQFRTVSSAGCSRDWMLLLPSAVHEETFQKFPFHTHPSIDFTEVYPASEKGGMFVGVREWGLNFEGQCDFKLE